MTGALVVHLNRGSLHEVDPTVEAFETDGSFDVELRNHGQAVHVHLRLDDPLDAVADVEETNYFVDTGATEVVHVRIDDDRSARGGLTVVSGYGTSEARVEVVVAGDGEGRSVDVAESLGRPGPRGDAALPEKFAQEGVLRVAGLAGLAGLLAVVSVVLAPSAVVALGALAVLAGIGTAGYLLVE